MGLAYAGVAEPEPEEVDEDVQRLDFLAAVPGAAVWGHPILIELLEPMRPDPPTPLPSRIGMSDVDALRTLTAKMRDLARC